MDWWEWVLLLVLWYSGLQTVRSESVHTRELVVELHKQLARMEEQQKRRPGG